MALIEEPHLSLSRIPAAIAGLHILSVGYLSLIAIRTIHRSKLALPPSTSTRHRELLRQSHVFIFSLLAFGSLTTAFLQATAFNTLSYSTWADERGVGLPTSFFGDEGILRGGHPSRLHLIRWLSDTPIYRDALEVVAENARFYWWGQQINLGLVSWSLFLAIEGQRRKISNLGVFLTLSQLVNLSYAQNLFFVAVLLTPVPLPDNVKEITQDSIGMSSSKHVDMYSCTRYAANDTRFSKLKSKLTVSKPEGFVPNTSFYMTLLLLNYTTIFLIPFASNTPSFPTISVISRTLPFAFLALPSVIPTSWGSNSTNPHTSHSSYVTLFRTVSTLSALLQLKTTTLAIFFNLPETHSYRPMIIDSFQSEDHSSFDRYSTAVTRLLGAVLEHPAIGAVWWDVILTGASLGLWAAFRCLDIQDMLSASVPFTEVVEKEIQEVEDAASEIKEDIMSPPQSTRGRGRGRGRPRMTDTPETNSTIASATPTLKRRGGPPKNISANKDSSYQPTKSSPFPEGDKDVEEDWDSAALTWGGLAVGGLGVAGAGVYGAEVRAR
ncbi:hypothetical protein BJ875DRAFT_442874 [Amylocarpus encephaloides]|uniref:Uncharacterized protein n=1 Tax=Amylocarpus encephaloides TaxID=45428 RepID=A0A9P7YF41_9HELO|nr:hypothetical protein BJ875DRAFT_442874 [Amylocarpus encephaloides]